MLRLVLIALVGLAGCDDDSAPADAAVDAGACIPDGAACLTVDDAGVSHGCTQGGMGPGDRDDGGGMATVGLPDLGTDVTNQPLAAPCLFNAQCTSNICFFYRVKGYFCTKACQCDSDCPAPFLGCSGQGVCRVPD